MKGLKINYKGENTIVAVKEGDLLVAYIHDVRGEAFFYVDNVDYDEQLGRVWYPVVPIELGDTLEFEVVETDQISEPVKIVEDKRIKRPLSELELFYELEAEMKNRGLL